MLPTMWRAYPTVGRSHFDSRDRCSRIKFSTVRLPDPCTWAVNARNCS